MGQNLLNTHHLDSSLAFLRTGCHSSTRYSKFHPRQRKFLYADRNESAECLIIVQFCIDKLKDRFTEKSLRFRRLLGMRYEAKGQLDEAQEVYDTILQEDDTNMVRRG